MSEVPESGTPFLFTHIFQWALAILGSVISLYGIGCLYGFYSSTQHGDSRPDLIIIATIILLGVQMVIGSTILNMLIHIARKKP